jgi:hypothetical protein
MGYWGSGKRAYHHTAPIKRGMAVSAAHKALA